MNLVEEENKYIPALRFDWLTKFYDPLLEFTLKEKVFKRRLIQQANIQPGYRVLDLGCGTATLTILLKQLHPETDVVGLDGDEEALRIAKRKIAAAGLEIKLSKGFSFDMNFPDNSFERVVSSLMFHHLTTESKLKTFVEVKRILKPGGELHVADWGKAQNLLMRGAFLMVQALDGFETTSANVQGKLPEYIMQAGFRDIEETQKFSTLFGSLSLLRAIKF